MVLSTGLRKAGFLANKRLRVLDTAQRRIALVITTLFATSVSYAAHVEQSEYADLVAEATRNGIARVMVTLDDTITLDGVSSNPEAVKAAMEQKARTLLSELGQRALVAGYWNNGMGQIGIHVTSDGLKTLASTTNAKAFMPDITHKARLRAHDTNGSLEAIETLIAGMGYADVEVFLNIDEGDYDIERDGRTAFRFSPNLQSQALSRLNSIRAQPFAKTFQSIDLSSLHAATPRPSFRVRVDRDAFYGLRESNEVRAIQPVGFVDARPAQWSHDALSAAQANEYVEVVITLRGGAIFSPKLGFMSARAANVQIDANRRALDDVLGSAGASLASSLSANYLAIGAAHLRLSAQAMRRLYENKDPRILSVTLNQPAASTLLTNSTTLLNMQPYWPTYRAAGQYVIVVDTGIRKDHEFFKMNGASKVVFEACFGTNGLDQNGVSWQSICPSQNGAGDSPSGQVGSGEPFANLTVCNTLASLPSPYTHDCSHGTHVSGIAAGRSSTNISPSTLQGVAPDAGLVAVQVFSYGNTSTSNPRASAFSADILGALNAVVSATAPGTNNPFVVNMSLGGEAYSSDCPTVYPGITNAIQNLSSQGVPVVVSTGNSGNYNGVSWPACVPQTIKVASVLNDSNGTSLAGFSNIGNPASFTGPILLTPGGGGGTTINSSDRASTTATKQMQGTSQAAPHAAGIYAAIKAAVPGISVADATAWIVSTASISVTYNLPTIGTQTYRRIRMP